MIGSRSRVQITQRNKNVLTSSKEILKNIVKNVQRKMVIAKLTPATTTKKWLQPAI